MKINNNFEYVRKALVKASDGEYSDYQYLYKIIKDSIQRETNKNQNMNSVDVDEKILLQIMIKKKDKFLSKNGTCGNLFHNI